MITYSFAAIVAVICMCLTGFILTKRWNYEAMHRDGFVEINDYLSDLRNQVAELKRDRDRADKAARLHHSVNRNLKDTIDVLREDGQKLTNELQSAIRAMQALEAELAYIKHPPAEADITSDDLDLWEHSEQPNPAQLDVFKHITDSFNAAIDGHSKSS